MRYFIVFFAFLLQSCCAMLGEKVVYKPGSVTYSCEGGKIQCLAERDSIGRVFIQLKSLEPNTKIEFQEIANPEDQEYIVKALMIVDKPDTGFAKSTYIKPLFIGISPVIVDISTLKGEIVFKTSFLEVTVD